MTKGKANSIANYLQARCDDAFIFVVKIGSGYLVDVKAPKGFLTLLSLLLNIIERINYRLKQEQQEDTRQLLLASLLAYLEDDAPPKPKATPQLSGKQLRKIEKNNQLILDAVEARLCASSNQNLSS